MNDKGEDDSNEETETSQKTSQSKNSSNRVLYKQKYRKVWEALPEFRCWLGPDPKNSGRAFCKVCKKNLHAHRLTLLKHTASLKHMKCAQNEYEKKSILKERLMESKTKDETPVERSIEDGEVINNPDNYCELLTDITNSSSDSNCGDSDKKEGCVTNIPEKRDTKAKRILTAKNGECHKSCNNCKNPTTVCTSSAPVVAKPPISTHVLDTSKGIPVPGVPVILYKLVEGRWTLINEVYTNPDGRCSDFIARKDFEPGRYKLHFDTDKYYELRKHDRLYPFIEIVFDLHSPMEHVHIPLLITPYGYTTYKGS